MVVAKTPQEELARCRRQRLPRTLRGVLPRLVLAAVVHGRHLPVLEDLGNLTGVEHVFVVGVHLHPRWVTDRVEAEFEMVREVGLLPEELQVYASLLSHKDEETSDPSVVTVCRWWERAL